MNEVLYNMHQTKRYHFRVIGVRLFDIQLKLTRFVTNVYTRAVVYAGIDFLLSPRLQLKPFLCKLINH